jgi:hypothetical protein
MTNRYRLLLLAVLLAAACYYVPAEQTETREWSSTGITRIVAGTENGAISVSARADTGIQALITRSCRGADREDAEKHLADIVITDSTHGGTLFLQADMPNWNARSYGADFDIAAPAATALDLTTSNGAVRIVGIVADITARTSNGAMEAANCAGAISMSTSNGAVTLTSTTGAAVIVTTNGRVTAAPHQGSIDARTTNGAMDCDLARFDTTDAATLHSSNGRVTVSLPADASVSFDAASSNGRVRVEGFSVNYTLNDVAHRRGTIGSGRATLNITTSNGDVTIRPR